MAEKTESNTGYRILFFIKTKSKKKRKKKKDFKFKY